MSLPPLPAFPPLPPAAQRVLHSLNTCTSPTHLPPLLSHILRHHLHLNSRVAAAFFEACSALRCPFPALSLFFHLSRPHVFVCNSLLRSLPLALHSPFLIYSRMLSSSVRPNHYTFPLLLKPLAALRLLPHGRAVHAHALRTGHADDLYVRNSLLSLYAACADVEACEKVFDEMDVKEVVAWSTLIMGFKNRGCYKDALIAFERMQLAGVVPNRVTMVNALAACAAGGALDTGAWIHNYIERSQWELDVVLGTSLIDMYGKCGRIDAGLSVFLKMSEKNVYTYNSLIGGLALAKNGEEAIRWFYRMEHEGLRPDPVTLIGVLCACSHSGLVEIGRRIFVSIINKKYGFYPSIKHYGCMVDLLGRAGFLDDALQCIERMPYKPNVVVWGSLLGGCRSHGDMRLSELAAIRLVELEPENVVHYVMLSRLYAEMGRWRDAEEVRRLMRERGLRKDAGWSFAGYEEIEACAGQNSLIS